MYRPRDDVLGVGAARAGLYADQNDEHLVFDWQDVPECARGAFDAGNGQQLGACFRLIERAENVCGGVGLKDEEVGIVEVNELLDGDPRAHRRWS